MSRAYYSASVQDFMAQDEAAILGTLVQNNLGDLTDDQRDAWIAQITILKRELAPFPDGWVAFEYTIPRMGKRVDNVLLYRGRVFLLEFKVNADSYKQADRDQVTDYALDLQNFHEASHNVELVPMLIATQAAAQGIETGEQKESIRHVVCCNGNNLGAAIRELSAPPAPTTIDVQAWLNSTFSPTPNIVEAAQALYKNHNVSDISRNDAGAINLRETSQAIEAIIKESKEKHQKSICFITGVPGAGKTLVGLNLASASKHGEEQDLAVFFSGNIYLVEVLQEALARDAVNNPARKTTKTAALRESSRFIQLVQHFRNDAFFKGETPEEKIAIFDEAQRAWSKEKFASTLKEADKPRACSEPELLIRAMNRHEDWAVLVCLVGGGQEIHNGETGIGEWVEAIERSYPDWHVYLSDRMTDAEYGNPSRWLELSQNERYHVLPELHLAVSMRSFRSEHVSLLMKCLLDNDFAQAKELYAKVKEQYPIHLTRNYEEAKQWVRAHANGSERYGVVAQSAALRLKPHGIWVEKDLTASQWFLNGKDDVRSSYFMEDVGTEFKVQGLELDWTVVAWDANLRIGNGEWDYFRFSGSKWVHINDATKALHLKNAYRVLLTRARQGMVIFVPHGDPNDHTRCPEWYDGIYETLKRVLQ